MAALCEIPAADPRAGLPRSQGQIPPQLSGLCVEHPEPVADDDFADHHLQLYVPLQHRKLPPLPDLRQHAVHLFQRERQHGPDLHHLQRPADQKGLYPQVHLPAQPGSLQFCDHELQHGGDPAGHAGDAVAAALDHPAVLGAAGVRAAVLLRHRAAAGGADRLLPGHAAPVQRADAGLDVRHAHLLPAGTAARRGAAADEAEPHVPLHQHVPQLCDVRQHPRPQHLDRLRGVRVRHAGHRAGGVPQTAAELYPVYLREGKQWNSRPCPWWK